MPVRALQLQPSEEHPAMSSMFRKGCIRARDAEKDTPLGTRMQVLGKFFETDKTQELAFPPRGEQGETTEKAGVPTSDFKAAVPLLWTAI